MSELPDNVTHLDEVVEKIQEKLREAASVCTKKVLPGTRGKIMLPLQEANTLMKGVEQVLKESGMGQKLGFVPTKKGIQPVVSKES